MTELNELVSNTSAALSVLDVVTWNHETFKDLCNKACRYSSIAFSFLVCLLYLVNDLSDLR